MFWIRYTERDSGGGLIAIETPLALSPTDVDYPPMRLFSQRTTPEGATVIQRPCRDARRRKWTWRGYGANHAAFTAVWATLAKLKTGRRVDAGLSATVELWEDVVGTGGFARTAPGTGARVFTTVKVLRADRAPRTGGGPVTLDSSIEFVIDDASYTTF